MKTIFSFILAFSPLFAHAIADSICIGTGVGICLNAPEGTKAGDQLTTVGGGVCTHQPTVTKTILEQDLKFECNPENLEACRQITGHANNAIGTNGYCYAVTGAN